MNVLPFTLFLSFLLALLFLALYIRSHHRNRHTSPEQQSLIPFRDDDSTPTPSEQPPKHP
ncbi:MAG: hypothetical protein PHF70_12855 [Opitutales bacterium]|nr:hypothetical protein [Opitutales bacterium]